MKDSGFKLTNENTKRRKIDQKAGNADIIDDDQLIKKVLAQKSNEIVSFDENSNSIVHVRDLYTLEPQQLLNDEVINFYMTLLQNKSNKRCADHPTVLFMPSFFYSTLVNKGYNAVKRWTTKVKLGKKGLKCLSIFELDKIIFPIHVKNMHWCCGCINIKDNKFEYYDSMHGSLLKSESFFEIIRKYIRDEFNDKLKGGDTTKYNLNLEEWNDDDNKGEYPQQEGNDNNCGVFTCKCAEWLADGKYPDYEADDMPDFRKKMQVEIIRWNDVNNDKEHNK